MFRCKISVYSVPNLRVWKTQILNATTYMLIVYALQFLLKLKIVAIFSFVNSKSNTYQEEQLEINSEQILQLGALVLVLGLRLAKKASCLRRTWEG